MDARARRRTATSTSAAASARSHSARSAAPVDRIREREHRRAPPRSAARRRAASPRSPRARPTRASPRISRGRSALTRELDHQRHRLGASPGPAGSRGRLSRRGARLLLSSEERFHRRRTLGRASPAARGDCPGRSRAASSSALVAVGETAGRRQRPARASRSSTRSSAGAVCGSRRSASPNQCAALAGASRDGFLAGLAQDGDGADVALARRALDVVGARRRRGAARRERLGAPLVGAEPPAAGGRLVDRAPDERMPEAEAPRHVGGADEVELQELVDGVHRRSSREVAAAAAASSGSNGSPATAAPSSTRRAASDSSASSSLSAAATARRDSDRRERRRVVNRSRRHRRGRATARAARGRTDCRRSPRRGRSRRRRSTASPSSSSRLVGRRARRARCASALPCGARARARPTRRSGTWRGRTRQRDQHRRRRRPAQQRADQLDRGRVRPVEIVEHEHERLRRCELLEQRAHRAVAAVALVLERHRVVGCERGQRREDVRELRPHVVVEAREPVRVEPSHVLVQRIDEDRERQVALELRARSRRARACPRASARAASSASRRVLPMPGSPTSCERCRARPEFELRRGPVERPELVGAPDEVLGVKGHVPPSAQDRSGSRHRRRSGWPPDVRRAARGQLGSCPVTCSTTATSRTSAASSSPRSRGTKPTSPPADVRVVPLRRTRDLVDGRRRQARRTRSRSCPSYVAERTTATRVSEVEIP